RVGEEEVVDTGAGEHLGLADCREREPGRPGVALEVGDLGGLVGLAVRAERQAAVRRELRHRDHVRGQHVEVDLEIGRRALPGHRRNTTRRNTPRTSPTAIPMPANPTTEPSGFTKPRAAPTTAPRIIPT